MYRVLIIDDDKLARKGLISIVPWADCGMEVVGDVSNGMKGLEFLESHTVDLVIVDLSMPVLSGLDFIQECRKRWSNIQFVVLSFHESFSYVQSALRLGALDYISKLQLEQEDCGEVFHRIGAALDAKMRDIHQEVDDAEDWDAAELNEIKDAWKTFYWVYDDGIWEDLHQELPNQCRSPRLLEHFLIWLLQSFEETFNREDHVAVPNFSDISSGVQWLSDYRQNLQERVWENPDFGQMSNCILYAVLYMKRNLGENIHADTVAAQVNMSRGYFSTNFKKMTGLTFNELLRKERVHEAQRLAVRDDMSLTDIACSVGYEDYKYFCRVFQEQVGCSLSEYRNCNVQE